MPSTPITPPGGGATTPATHPGNSYVGSGICSGTAFTHQQSLYISYQTSSADVLKPTWLPATGTPVSGLICWAQANFTDSLDQFSTSSNDGSSCANAANDQQLHVLDFSALQHTGGGLGFSGYISTSANGFTRRWAAAGDANATGHLGLGHAWFPVDVVTYQAMLGNTTVAKAVIRSMVERMTYGGIEYWAGNSYNDPPSVHTSPPFPGLRQNLIYI